MRTTITSADLLAILQKMATDMAGQKDYLCELDGAMGDGDQGVTMAIGFGAIQKGLASLQGQDIGTIITKSGLTFNGTAASTIGALLATACLRAGREVKGKQEIGVADLATMSEAAYAGIQERGKAQVGDKTVLDALAPTVAALKTAAAQGTPLPAALAQALAAAEAGLTATIPMKSKVGRAAWIAERSVGHQDPGATSFYLMLKSAVEYLTELPAKLP
jgi:phosphoenolpyruvate---glycerone phosphotransferase subunit DhaL